MNFFYIDFDFSGVFHQNIIFFLIVAYLQVSMSLVACLSTVGSPQSAVGSRQSAVGSRQLAVVSRKSAVGSPQFVW